MLKKPRSKSQTHLWITILACLTVIPLLAIEYRANVQPTPIANAPLLTPASGHFSHPILVEMAGAPAKSQIYYTLNGSDPRQSGTPYTAPLPLTGDGVTVIRSRYQNQDGSWSDGTIATYVVGLQTSLPVLSVIAEPADLHTPERGVLANPFGRGIEWEREVQLMFFEGDRSDTPQQLAFTSPAGLRVHGSASRTYPKLSLRLYFRGDYGNPRLNYPLYEGQTDMLLNNFDRLILHGGSQDYATPLPDARSNWTLLRTALLYELAAEMGMYTTQSRPTLLFINGQSYGVYQIRTFPDETYLEERYGIGVADMFALSGHPSSPNEMLVTERLAQWEEVLSFVETNDIHDPAVYAQVGKMVDIDLFIDYVILEFYAGNTDWLRNNVRIFRNTTTNQWSWLVWDVDQGLGLAPWSDVNINMIEWLYTTERPGFERGSLLLRRLFENEIFRAQYLKRLDELLTTTLAPDKVAAQLDTMAAEIRPDIAFETNVWTSSGAWETSVAEMRDFVIRRPDILREHHEDW